VRLTAIGQPVLGGRYSIDIDDEPLNFTVVGKLFGSNKFLFGLIIEAEEGVRRTVDWPIAVDGVEVPLKEWTT
jgi:hypothetical protein